MAVLTMWSLVAETKEWCGPITVTANGTPVPAIAWIRASWSPGSRRSARELASPLRSDGSPTATISTCQRIVPG